eukprot:CAMPEP_0203638942 /NCGR_PEP_ID=MMETSP0088-20131115/4815_1 /ASSEMBLY_ACC=CAM_ASM_001087 /TAXON_ID=426623 /ORGANISM="Chaetoceros affinis, Strain CCMP159" /LENGTH=236 /DNA_ID=CAMNT_0050493689 /DNA_START=362 /DNA_END=1072 /DNA_ORIENTATION=+
MPSPTPAAAAGLSTIDNLLSTILNSRLQRKAKSIILSSVEFLIVDFAVLQTYLQLEIQNPAITNGLRISLFVGAAYVAALALFLFVHSFVFLRVTNMKTTDRIENAYAKTNRIPLLDGILELPFPVVFRGSWWILPYVAWLACGSVIGVSSYLFWVVREELDMTALATLAAGALLLYQITSDFSEYWVHSRHREEVNGGTANSSSSASASAADASDEEASNLVGRREVSSAGFTRL